MEHKLLRSSFSCRLIWVLCAPWQPSWSFVCAHKTLLWGWMQRSVPENPFSRQTFARQLFPSHQHFRVFWKASRQRSNIWRINSVRFSTNECVSSEMINLISSPRSHHIVSYLVAPNDVCACINPISVLSTHNNKLIFAAFPDRIYDRWAWLSKPINSKRKSFAD